MIGIIETYKATICFTAPTAYRAMMAAMDAGADLSSLRLAVSAGETLPAPGLPRLGGEDRHADPRRHRHHRDAAHLHQQPRRRRAPGCTGRPVTGYEARIVDEHMREVPRGTVGGSRSAGRPDAAISPTSGRRAYVRDGWNLTGDAFSQDEDGRFHFAARTDDMILSAGYNIAGPEVEAALLAHAGRRRMRGGRAARRGAGPDRRRVRGAAAGRDPRRGHGEAAAGSREGVDCALQVPARRQLRRPAAEDGDREDSALSHARLSRGRIRADHAHLRSCSPTAGRRRAAMPMAWRPRAGWCSWPDRSAGTLAASSRPTTSSAQVEQALANVVAVLGAGGAGPEHLVRMTWYVTDKAAYVARRRDIGEAYRRVIGRHFPAMTLVVVAGLLEDRALVEIEATAVRW